MAVVILGIFSILIIVSILYGFIEAVIMDIKIRKYDGNTIGTIISVREIYTYNKFSKIYYYYPTFRYIVNGTVYEEEFPFNEKRKELLPIGGEKMLRYDKNNPTNFFPIEKETAWSLQAFVCFIIIVLFISMALFIFFRDYR